MTVDGVVYCKCGAPSRPRQRTCRPCHRQEVKASREKGQQRLERALRVIDNLTVRNTETQAAFDAVCKTNAVVVRGIDGTPDISGIVVGFLPGNVLKVLDDDGRTHVIPLEHVQEDFGRTFYGRHKYTEFHTKNPAGDQGSAPSQPLEALCPAGHQGNRGATAWP